MAAPRLPFLWPMLYKSIEAPAVRSSRAATQAKALYSTTRRRQQETVPQRYGAANELPDYLGGGRGLGPTTRPALSGSTKALPKIGEKLQQHGEEEVEAEREEASQKIEDQVKRFEPTTPDGSFVRPLHSDPMLDSAESIPREDPPGAPKTPDEKPLASVLDDVPEPSLQQAQEKGSSDKALGEGHPVMSMDEHTPPVRAPHIETPRYVHHFDTYGLVKRLSDAGWSEVQAITVMKCVRLMLADNMDLAKEALVSKSNVENETYLFRAACAELKTEVTSRRKAEQEKMRTERTQLQHEVDILGQRLGQESAHLKDELKGMFDDRKMAVRNEQRTMESKVQQLNYKITVCLQADAKSDVEGLRWVLTRRVIIALGAVVVMVLASLKLYSTAVHEQGMREKTREKGKRGGSGVGVETKGGELYVGADTGVDAGGKTGEVVLEDGDNAGLVSLG